MYVDISSWHDMAKEQLRFFLADRFFWIESNEEEFRKLFIACSAVAVVNLSLLRRGAYREKCRSVQ